MQRPNLPLSLEGLHRQLIQVQTQRDTLGLPVAYNSTIYFWALDKYSGILYILPICKILISRKRQKSITFINKKNEVM